MAQHCKILGDRNNRTANHITVWLIRVRTLIYLYLSILFTYTCTIEWYRTASEQLILILEVVVLSDYMLIRVFLSNDTLSFECIFILQSKTKSIFLFSRQILTLKDQGS